MEPGAPGRDVVGAVPLLELGEQEVSLLYLRGLYI